MSACSEIIEQWQASADVPRLCRSIFRSASDGCPVRLHFPSRVCSSVAVNTSFAALHDMDFVNRFSGQGSFASQLNPNVLFKFTSLCGPLLSRFSPPHEPRQCCSGTFAACAAQASVAPQPSQLPASCPCRTAPVQQHLQRMYVTLSGALLAAAAGVYVSIATGGWLGGWLAIAGFVGSSFWLASTPASPAQLTKR